MLDQEIWAVPYEHTMRYTPEELQEVSSEHGQEPSWSCMTWL